MVTAFKSHTARAITAACKHVTGSLGNGERGALAGLVDEKSTHPIGTADGPTLVEVPAPSSPSINENVIDLLDAARALPQRGTSVCVWGSHVPGAEEAFRWWSAANGYELTDLTSDFGGRTIRTIYIFDARPGAERGRAIADLQFDPVIKEQPLPDPVLFVAQDDLDDDLIHERGQGWSL